MQLVSAKFLKEVTRSHRVVAYVDATSPTGQTIRLDATDGSVSIDRTADIRRRITVSCADRTGTITPTSSKSILTPYGTILRAYRGVEYADGTGSEVVPLGVFQLSNSKVHDQAGGSPVISLDGFDLSRKVGRHKFTSIYTVNTGDNLVDAIKLLVQRTLPDVDFDLLSSAMVAPAPIVFDTNTDPWAAIATLAQSVGAEAYFGATGRLHLHPAADIDHLAAPNFTYVEGKGCIMLDLDVSYTDDPGYNGVVLTGASVGDDAPPVRSIQWDNEPTSPTYHLGPYGEVPTFVEDQNITTQEDADKAAIATLNGLLGFSSQLSVTAGVNPALDANDVIQVTRQRSGINARYVVDSLSIPLRGTATSALSLRTKRTV